MDEETVRRIVREEIQASKTVVKHPGKLARSIVGLLIGFVVLAFLAFGWYYSRYAGQSTAPLSKFSQSDFEALKRGDVIIDKHDQEWFIVGSSQERKTGGNSFGEKSTVRKAFIVSNGIAVWDNYVTLEIFLRDTKEIRRQK